MGVNAAFGVEQGGDAGVSGTDEVGRGNTFGGAGAALSHEVEEDAIEEAGCLDVANGDTEGDGRGLVACGQFLALDSCRGGGDCQPKARVCWDLLAGMRATGGLSAVLSVEEEAQIQPFTGSVHIW